MNDIKPPNKSVQSITNTNPIIQVTPNSKYNINIYRAIDDGSGKPGTFSLLNGVTVSSDGIFIDTQNPYPKYPPTPTAAPVFHKWNGG
jgi:hypothetical protein